jgi:hypothetical protein
MRLPLLLESQDGDEGLLYQRHSSTESMGHPLS